MGEDNRFTRVEGDSRKHIPQSSLKQGMLHLGTLPTISRADTHTERVATEERGILIELSGWALSGLLC